MSKTYSQPWGQSAWQALLDFVTGAVRTISSDHSAIHNGEGFNAWVYAEGVADDGYKQIEFVTPAVGYVHMKLMTALAEGLASFEVVEAPTLSSGSTAFTPVNLRRVGTPPASTCTLKTDSTYTSGGTVIRAYLLGQGSGGNSTGGTQDKDIELVLKPETTYLFRVRNLAGSAKALSLWLFWYEEGMSGAE